VFKNEHRADVDKVMIHPNGNYLAAGTCSGEVHIWDVRTTSLKSQHVAQSRSCLGAVNSISFSTNGRLMAVAGQDNQILIWDFAYMNFPVAVLSGHESSIHSLEFCEGNSDILASGSSDCTVKIWDVSKFNGRTTPGRIKATSSTKNITTSVDTASTLFLLASFPTKRTPIYDLRFTDENLLLVAGVFSPMKAL
jgi:transcription initiation factor TFIID subunit 5